MKAIKIFAAGLAMTALTAGAALAGDVQASLETRHGPDHQSVRCPHKVVFQGAISSRVAGLVQYRIVRSNGRLSPVKSITFHRPGDKQIQSTQTVRRSGQGWQMIEVLYPSEVRSRRARYNVTCGRFHPEPPRPAPGPHAPGPPPGPRPHRLGEDCVSFNPHRLHVQKRGHAFSLVDGPHQVAYFGRKAGEADRALEIIKYYRMNRLCFVDRPGPAFKYLLASGQAPSGRLAGQDCVSFDPGRLKVKSINGSYKIVDRGHYLFDFGGNKRAALKALEIIRRHGFRRSCFVGRPGPSFSYLLR